MGEENVDSERKKVLLVYLTYSSFVERDHKILESQYEVRTVRWRGKRDLFRLLKGIRSETDVLETFGPPCREVDAGLIVEEPEKDNEPARSKAFRTLVYKELSPVADIRFHIDEGGVATANWTGKYLGKQDNQQEDETTDGH